MTDMLSGLKGLAGKALAAALSDRDLVLQGMAPAGFHVQGDLSLIGEKGLKSLPEGLSVSGTLNLMKCSSLKSLPTGLVVGKDLVLSGCDSLKELSAGMKVKGDLVLEGHQGIEALPQDLEVGGSLRLEGCTVLRRLPDPLRLKGSLGLRGCTALLELPNLWVQGNLEIQGCLGIQHLSQAHRVERDILAGGSGIRSLPLEMAPLRNLDLSDCTHLTQLPRKLSCSGSVILAGCTGLQTLPTGLHVKGDLNLSGCSALKSLPGGLRVDGSANFSNCTKLETIPKDAKIAEQVRVSGCASMRVLRGDFNFGSNLDLSGLTELEVFDPLPTKVQRITIKGSKRLAKIPAGLVAELLVISDCLLLEEIKADIAVTALRIENAPKLRRIDANIVGLQALSLDRCQELEELPKGLNLRTLSVHRCQKLKRVPTDIKIAGIVEFMDCPSLEALSLTVQRVPRSSARAWGLSTWFTFSFSDLHISRCHKLKVLVLSGLAGSTTIEDCPSLVTVRGALAVEALNVVFCSQLRTLEILLSDIEHLQLVSCGELTALPSSVEQLKNLQVRDCLKLGQQPWRIKISGLLGYQNMAPVPLPAGLFFKPGARLEFSGSEIEPRDPRLKGVDLRWNGVPADDRILHPAKIQAKDILEEKNAAIRSALFTRMGLARFLSEAEAKIIDSDLDAGGRRELIEVPMPAGEAIVGLKVICPSTAHVHFLRVPPQVRDCVRAAAWIAGFDDPEDYKPVQES